ncbi:hypothetical protein J7K86_00190, partial [bacterium]|nr:hypothetical protein [bacterium]
SRFLRTPHQICSEKLFLVNYLSLNNFNVTALCPNRACRFSGDVLPPCHFANLGAGVKNQNAKCKMKT